MFPAALSDKKTGNTDRITWAGLLVKGGSAERDLTGRARGTGFGEESLVNANWGGHTV